MEQHTTASTSPSAPLPPLLQHLGAVRAAHRSAVRQERCFARLGALVRGPLYTPARRTVAQLLLGLGLSAADWSAFYRLFSRPRVDYDALTRGYLRQSVAEIPARAPFVAVLDGVQLPRSSGRRPGTSGLKNPRTPPFKPGIHRAQRFLHLAALLPRWNGYSRALPLRFVPAFPPQAVPGAAAPQTEWQAGGAQLHWLRAELDASGRTEQPVLALGDGNFDVVELWPTLPERTVLLARTARNRALYALRARRAGRGRPPVYGPHAPTPAQWLHARGGWQQTTVRVRGRDIPLRYRVEGPFLRYDAPAHPVFLLVVRGAGRGQGQRRARKPAFYLVSAVQRAGARAWVLPWPAEELLGGAWQRWEVEVSQRGMKTDWGVGQVQCWQPLATVRAVQVRSGPTASASWPATAPGATPATPAPCVRPACGGPALRAGVWPPCGAAISRPSPRALLFPPPGRGCRAPGPKKKPWCRRCWPIAGPPVPPKPAFRLTRSLRSTKKPKSRVQSTVSRWE